MRWQVIAVTLTAAKFWLAIAAAQDVTEAGRPDSRPRLVRKLEVRDHGSKYSRLGDLDGDGLVDILLVQGTAPPTSRGGPDENRVRITCLTAINLDGEVLWQTGTPDLKNSYVFADYPVQIHDLDGDGDLEVVYIADEQNILSIAEGKSGQIVRTVQLAGGHDSLLFADLAGVGRATDLVVKDRYENFWVYNREFELLWSKSINTGHYPREFDFDRDGRDELLCGYTLYDPTGRELWNHDDFPQHNDAVDIADMDGDGSVEIAVASSENAYLLAPDGQVLFMRPMGHCQHALIGKFRLDLPGEQVFFLDRRANSTNYDRPRKPFGDLDRSNACLLTKAGELLWNDASNKWWAAGTKVLQWTANPQENFILIYSRGYAPPGLFDGHGREMATFPFPEAIVKPGGGPEGRDLYEDELVQHVDCWGDAREEILLFNQQAIRIYTNAAVNQPPRMYNNNFYPGRH